MAEIWDSDAWREFIAPLKDGAQLKIWWNEEGQMTKWRSREIVEAVQWFPGKEIKGVIETKDGRAVFTGSINRYGMALIEPGDYIVTDRDANTHHFRRDQFEADYENVGG